MRLQHRRDGGSQCPWCSRRLGRRGTRPGRSLRQACPANCRLLDPAGVAECRHIRWWRAVGVGVRVCRPPDEPVAAPGGGGTAEHGGAVTAQRSRGTTSGATEHNAAANWRSAFLRMPYQRDASPRSYRQAIQKPLAPGTVPRYSTCRGDRCRSDRDLEARDRVVTCRFALKRRTKSRQDSRA